MVGFHKHATLGDMIKCYYSLPGGTWLTHGLTAWLIQKWAWWQRSRYYLMWLSTWIHPQTHKRKDVYKVLNKDFPYLEYYRNEEIHSWFRITVNAIMLRGPWYTDNNFRSVHGAHTARILSFWSSMTVALGNSIAGLHPSYNIHTRKCYFFVHNVECLWCWKPCLMQVC